MVTKAYAFEFDPYGDNPNNKITKERHTITPAGSGQTNFFIPSKGPFHRRGFVLRNATTQLPLRPGYDYYFGFRFDQMILSGAMQPIYGAIVLNDPASNLVVEIDYQTVGGEFTLDTNQITTLLANKLLDPRTVTWSAVVDIPSELPAVAHRHNAGTDLVGMNEVVARLYDLIDAQEAGYNKALQALLEHIADHANPHKITLQDLGIDSLGGLVPATKEQAEAGTDNSRYMTALRTAEYCNAKVVPVITAHANNKNNPHGTTKAHVGLGSVDNFATATTVEAQAGVATNRFMTPATTKAAIDALAPQALSSHTGNMNNPHGTTKAQVGLGSVPNYAMATLAEAISGTSTTTFMSPYLVAQALSNGSGQGLSAHLLDYDNPHKTTKAQVGLSSVPNYGVATVQEAIAGAATDKFMTPYLVAQAMANGAGSDVGMHLIDYDNPHRTTKTHVGLGNVQNYGVATPADVNAMTATDKYLVVASLPTFLNGPVATFMRNNLSGSITKMDIGLGNVENYAVATDRDVIARANDKYMTVETGYKLLEQNIQTLPAFTFNAANLSALLTRVPLSNLVADNQYRIITGSDYWQVRFPATDAPDEDTYAYTWTDIDTTVHTGTYAYTAEVDQLAGQVHIAVFARAEDVAAGMEYYYGLGYAAGKLSLYEISTGGFAVALPLTVAIPSGNQAALGDHFRYAISQVLGSGAVSATVKSMNGTYTSPTLNITPALIATNSDNWDDTATVILKPVFGVVALAPTGKLTGGKYYPSRVPNISSPTLGVVGTGTVYRYNPVTGTWAIDAATKELDFERGLMYYSEKTDELGIAVVDGKLFPLGTSYIPGNVRIGGNLTVDGDVQFEMP